jgi:ABC-2 type transport system ATP-binding protein
MTTRPTPSWRPARSRRTGAAGDEDGANEENGNDERGAAVTAVDDEVISTRDLRKRFRSKKGPVDAVRGVSFDVHRGEIFGFLGPNGAGKTTTMRMLTTLLPIEEGTATVTGVDVAREPQTVRERIGYVSQLGGADELATGRENLILQGRLYGDSLATVTARADRLMDILDLSEFAARRVKTYSGGQRRRLDVALGIVHEPQVLFLDEPSTGLDPQNRANLWEHIEELRQLGTTIFLTTHYLEEADALCDRLVIMDHGEVVAEGTPRDLKRDVSGDSVVLDLHADDGTLARARDVVAAAPYVRELSLDGTQLRCYVEDGGTALPSLLRLLDREQIGLRSIQLSEPTLDDVFLRHTGRSLRDAGAGAGGSGSGRGKGAAA